MMEIATCPNCGVELEEDDIYDTSSGDGYVEYVVGHCPNCNKEYQWKNYYDFSGVGEIEEVS